MFVEYREIKGWKWETIEELQRAEDECKRLINLPQGEADITKKYIDPVEERDPATNNLLFYYSAYSYPSQLEIALGTPKTFTIQVIHEP